MKCKDCKYFSPEEDYKFLGIVLGAFVSQCRRFSERKAIHNPDTYYCDEFTKSEES